MVIVRKSIRKEELASDGSKHGKCDFCVMAVAQGVVWLINIFCTGGGGHAAPGKLIVQFELLFASGRSQINRDLFIGDLAIDSAACG